MSLQLMDSLLFSVTSTFPVTLFSSFLSYSFLCFTFFFTEEKVKRKPAIKFEKKKKKKEGSQTNKIPPNTSPNRIQNLDLNHNHKNKNNRSHRKSNNQEARRQHF